MYTHLPGAYILLKVINTSIFTVYHLKIKIIYIIYIEFKIYFGIYFV